MPQPVVLSDLPAARTDAVAQLFERTSRDGSLDAGSAAAQTPQPSNIVAFGGRRTGHSSRSRRTGQPGARTSRPSSGEPGHDVEGAAAAAPHRTGDVMAIGRPLAGLPRSAAGPVDLMKPPAPAASRRSRQADNGDHPPVRSLRGLAAPRSGLDVQSRSWWERLHATEPVRGRAIAELHERLRREAAFHIRIRVRNVAAFPRSDIDDLATQAADDALMALLRKLDDFRGDSEFWTWARRFAALEAPVSIRRRLGRDRVGISHDPERALDMPDSGHAAHDRVELRELLAHVIDAIADQLTPLQRTVMIATAINGVPAQTLALELHTTPGAIYKTLHDARRKLRAQLAY